MRHFLAMVILLALVAVLPARADQNADVARFKRELTAWLIQLGDAVESLMERDGEAYAAQITLINKLPDRAACQKVAEKCQPLIEQVSALQFPIRDGHTRHANFKAIGQLMAEWMRAQTEARQGHAAMLAQELVAVYNKLMRQGQERIDGNKKFFLDVCKDFAKGLSDPDFLYSCYAGNMMNYATKPVDPKTKLPRLVRLNEDTRTAFAKTRSLVLLVNEKYSEPQ